MTSHPKDMTSDLINCYEDCEKLMPFLHLPIQSGSDKILKLMNRKHDKKYYFSVIEKLKSINKDIKFSSDFIIGYPGEEEKILSGYDYNLTTQLPYHPWINVNLQGYKWKAEKATVDTKGMVYSSEFNISPITQLNLSVDPSNLSEISSNILFVS